MPKIIGIYGLAANPPTLGHTHVIKSVLDANIVDEIWVVPFMGRTWSLTRFAAKCVIVHF